MSRGCRWRKPPLLAASPVCPWPIDAVYVVVMPSHTSSGHSRCVRCWHQLVAVDERMRFHGVTRERWLTHSSGPPLESSAASAARASLVQKQKASVIRTRVIRPWRPNLKGIQLSFPHFFADFGNLSWLVCQPPTARSSRSRGCLRSRDATRSSKCEIVLRRGKCITVNPIASPLVSWHWTCAKN